MSNAAVVAEIARLESEIGRIQRELDALKQSLGVNSSRRTQAFPNPVALSKDAQLSEPPMDTPQPSIPLASETIPTSKGNKSDRRVAQGGRTGLTDYPPSANPTPSRRGANVDPAAGRYEYVGEGRSSKSRR
jgi:hypothetical protein